MDKSGTISVSTETPEWRDGRFVLVINVDAPRAMPPAAFERAFKHAEYLMMAALAENDLKFPDVDYKWPPDQVEINQSSDMAHAKIKFGTPSRPPIKRDKKLILASH